MYTVKEEKVFFIPEQKKFLFGEIPMVIKNLKIQ